ncbi:MAG: chemotaxis protein CheA [Spirochaetes bacterium]|nr:chemotaxis protein CheA [Spirochaetota bacterium]
MKETSIRDVFLNEAREILAGVESDLVLLEEGGDAELLNRIFRCAHTLKGSSSMAGFGEVSAFMHGLESVLDRLRSGDLAVSESLVNLFLGSFDWVKLALFGGDDGTEGNGMRVRLEEMMAEYTGDEAPSCGRVDVAGKSPEHRSYRVRARFREGIFGSGIDPLSIIEDFISLGEIEDLKVDTSALPGLMDLDPEKCHLAWDVTVRTVEPLAKAEEVFLFVRDDNEILLEDVTDLHEEKAAEEERCLEDRKIGEILLRRGIVTGKELDEVLSVQDGRNRRIGDIIVEKGFATEEEIRAALREQDRIRTRIDNGTVRVETRKLDVLMNLLGEIVIGQSGLARIAEELQDEQGQRLTNALYGLDRTTREFQEQIMSIRMIPVGPVFGQFRRFVRDAARDHGKEIRLEIYGEETELDKTVIEKIGDPLKHMIRNAIDHGIEGPEERVAAGKGREGRIRLNAYHREGSVYIEVSDDGRGLDRERIRAKAVDLGLLKPDEEVDDDDISKLLFAPGLTTAESAGDLSGRGVGMDVVKTNIEALRGTVEIESVKGAGTTLRIRLPLTMAIIEGMLVRSGANVFIIPLLSIIECVQPAREDIETVGGRGELLMVRGTCVPLVRLYDYFETTSLVRNPWEALVIIVESGRDMLGIMVDEVVGQQQIVIKSLGDHVTATRAVSGAAILGDGRVALILDVHGLSGEIDGSSLRRKVS